MLPHDLPDIVKRNSQYLHLGCLSRFNDKEVCSNDRQYILNKTESINSMVDNLTKKKLSIKQNTNTHPLPNTNKKL